MNGTEWHDEELEMIVSLRRQGERWTEIAPQIAKKFQRPATPDSVRRAWARYQDAIRVEPMQVALRSQEQRRRAQRTSSYNARVARQALDHLDLRGSVIEELHGLMEKLQKKEFKPPRIKKDRKKHDMIIELMLSDLHIGKLVVFRDKTLFNHEIARIRMREVARVTLLEIERERRDYNVVEVIVALLGDLIESYEMHDLESARNCEFGTAKQVMCAARSIFEDIIVPLASTGIPMRIPAVTGNHDRSERKRTYVKPGETNWTFVVYHYIKDLCEAHGFHHIKWEIPDEPFCVLDIFGTNVLFEHLDNTRGKAKKTLEDLIADRMNQLGIVIDGVRGGHYHQHVCDDLGRFVINLSLAGKDWYSTVNRWRSRPGQVLNYYLDYPMKLEPGERKNVFHKSFPIKLGGVGCPKKKSE